MRRPARRTRTSPKTYASSLCEQRRHKVHSVRPFTKLVIIVIYSFLGHFANRVFRAGKFLIKVIRTGREP